MIHRDTKGGHIALMDPADDADLCCALCGGEGSIVLDVQGGAAHFDGIICGDCLAEALALAFGRKHVRDGGNVADLAIPAAASGEVCYREPGDLADMAPPAPPRPGLKPDPSAPRRYDHVWGGQG